MRSSTRAVLFAVLAMGWAGCGVASNPPRPAPRPGTKDHDPRPWLPERPSELARGPAPRLSITAP